jgi:hypothetical protein
MDFLLLIVAGFPGRNFPDRQSCPNVAGGGNAANAEASGKPGKK